MKVSIASHWICGFFGLLLCAGCSETEPETELPSAPATSGPAILLVTLDTTRADVFDLPREEIDLPTFRRLDERGLFFTQAYSTAPMTAPAHASMLTGHYPGPFAAGHGIHENGRALPSSPPRLAEQLSTRGVRTAAFVSAFPLASRFGWALGFDTYDDAFGARGQSGAVERSAADTTDRAVDYLKSLDTGPTFTWVHYFDPHEPYEPPEPFRSRYADAYRAEIAALDPQLDRLLRAFESAVPDADGRRILVVGDHGEGRGDHGEALHGNLLYQETMRVPLWIVAPGVEPGRRDAPVSIRQVYGTVAAWAGLESSSPGLLEDADDVVLGEAMKPFLQYGWRPQTMAVRGTTKVIYDGEVQLYDLAADPGERHDLSSERQPPAELLDAVREYPVPEPGGAHTGSQDVALDDTQDETLDDEARQALAALGYVQSEASAPRRADAPRPIEMVELFSLLDRSSGLFVREQYRQVVPLAQEILRRDPGNFMVRLRLAVSYSLLGRPGPADAEFERAARTAPDSDDLLLYRTQHALRFGRTEQAEPWLAELLRRTPDRVAALDAMARLREMQGRPRDAADLLTRALAGRSDPKLLGEFSGRLGNVWMQLGETELAIAAFEDERLAEEDDFDHALELGVSYLAAGRVDEAADSLDQVPEGHPGHSMALFKRAQAAVLLGEPDSARRIRRAWDEGDSTTRELIRSEQLFEGWNPQ